MGVDEDFERVRTSLRLEEQALAREFDQIDAEARATVDASVEHVRTQLATQADRIREAIAQQRAEVETRSRELREEVEAQDATDRAYETDETDEAYETDETDRADEEDLVAQPDGTAVEQVSVATDEPGETIGDVERGD
ncbi:hypothetical protein KKR89_16335 [Cellulomonas dongxiuzhuiae]|uniref:Uncharacterized protein n=1 Tax=Cellulomonas dongxiuzhuiae TaxID=2819979 RepID=A0ABX8GII5_9CELL|nr:hypothetical protein [Cellulomonas dongxiuzhuiae]QWC15810.1 hypothetical protein KKR89_16335 [Cellulomonas dongxiuzhuiae]